MRYFGRYEELELHKTVKVFGSLGKAVYNLGTPYLLLVDWENYVDSESTVENGEKKEGADNWKLGDACFSARTLSENVSGQVLLASSSLIAKMCRLVLVGSCFSESLSYKNPSRSSSVFCLIDERFNVVDH